MSGRLIVLVGPSGVGKDSVLAHARASLARLPQGGGVRFARRAVTRPATAGGEDHLALSEDEFHSALDEGRFALWWGSHGLHYGIDREIDDWLAAGLTVVVNGSRAHLPLAWQRYPRLEAVLLTARPDTLAKRLAARGREDEAAVAARLARTPPPLPDGMALTEIANDGELAEAGDQFVALLLTAPTGSTAEAPSAPDQRR
ncbi:phosphonate metabolism protein/1,5-bisphosphokinase (PRPP-forming) PhnN [Chitiniphilus shinanonensis]|uniref:phosphonate metabolism protein/1,5-bisphosphokinase (PRPP-forming) PhnN n=1 Tax=Chitiniphilus shinanonensis TaxID=553088 RepID=UPI000368EDED|nr:phosphonate metabolism protein/1,5-bisphosphokinase (PRPP-forming) PhnN [Chitiniphilus shinanonensis]